MESVTRIGLGGYEVPEGKREEAYPKSYTHEDMQSVPDRKLYPLGPIIRFQELVNNERTWRGSVLLGVQARQKAGTLFLQTSNLSITAVEPEEIDCIGDVHYCRYPIEAPRDWRTKWVLFDVAERVYRFAVPGLQQAWEIGVCFPGGLRQERGSIGIEDHLLAIVQDKPMHLLVAGGGQVDASGLFELPSLAKWMAIKDPLERLKAKFTEEMRNAVTGFFQRLYTESFNDAFFGQLICSVPLIMAGGSADLVPGLGLMSDNLRSCEVINGVMAIAVRFYLTMQHHTNKTRVGRDRFIGEGTTQMKTLGAVALLLLDTWSERKRQSVMPGKTWQQVMQAVEELPSGVRQLVVVCSHPLAFPELGTARRLSEETKGALRIADIGSYFLQDLFCESQESPDVFIDDAADLWRSLRRNTERLLLIDQLRHLSEKKQIRILVVSDSVGITGLGTISRKGEGGDPYTVHQVLLASFRRPPLPSALESILCRQIGVKTALSETMEEELVSMPPVASIQIAKPLLARHSWLRLGARRQPRLLELELFVERRAEERALIQEVADACSHYRMTLLNTENRREAQKGEKETGCCQPPPCSIHCALI